MLLTRYFQVDKSRMNEFGFSGDMLDEATAAKEVTNEATKKAGEGEDKPKSQEAKKTD